MLHAPIKKTPFCYADDRTDGSSAFDAPHFWHSDRRKKRECTISNLKFKRNAFERISTIARTIGCYAIPRPAHETRSRQFYGQTASLLGWSSNGLTSFRTSLFGLNRGSGKLVRAHRQ